MKGLLLKDFLMLREQSKTLGITLLVWAFFAFTTKSALTLTAIVCVFSVMLPITGVAYDERAHWDQAALTMPLKRNEIVLSKYLMSLCLILLGILTSIIFVFVMNQVSLENIFTILAFIPIGILYLSMMMPILFKFGSEKARIIAVVVIVVPIGLLLLVSQSGLLDYLSDIHLDISQFILLFPYILAIFSLLVFFLSYKISVKIYRKKEF